MVPRGWSYDKPLGIVKAFLTQSSVFDDDPALNFITEAVKPYESIKRRWTTAALDANTGEYVAMN